MPSEEIASCMEFLPTRTDRSARANLAALLPAKGPAMGPFAGSCWEITVHFSLSAGATPDFLFTLRFTEGLLNSWPGPGGRTGVRNSVPEQVRAAGDRHRHSVADGRRADTARKGAVREQDRGGGARAAAD